MLLPVATLLFLSYMYSINSHTNGQETNTVPWLTPLFALLVIALIMLYSIISEQSTLIDLVIVTAIAGFISVTVIGIYIERTALGKTNGEREEP